MADNITLIADSGSTKTDWAVVYEGRVVDVVVTQGLNPVAMQSAQMADVLKAELLPRIAGRAVSGVFFYGAGCRGGVVMETRRTLAEALGIGMEDVEVHSDLLAAARAVCGRKEGIVCILGTGANSCVYDGSEITANIPPLGYILGDEGSGAVLGRMFLNAIFKNPAMADVREEYLQATGLAYDDIINKVYRQPLANRFLASVSEYISAHIGDGRVRDIVKDNFSAFFRNNVERYNRTDLEVSAVGSIAFHYQGLLREAAAEHGYTMGRISKSPIGGLAEYHLSK